MSENPRADDDWWKEKPSDAEEVEPIEEIPEVKEEKKKRFEGPKIGVGMVYTTLKILALVNMAINIVLIAFFGTASVFLIQVVALAYMIPNTFMLFHYRRLLGEKKNVVSDWPE